MCGYHLRCLNCGNECAECKHQHNDKDFDYLKDALGVWPKGEDNKLKEDEDVEI